MAIVEKAMPLGGGGLNFKVVGGTTQPTNPKENTIWVNTDVTIGEWQMAYVAPTTRADGSNLVVGDVWLKIGNGNSCMNILRKNGLHISIASSYQWNGSDWVFKASSISSSEGWQSGDLVLFKDGVFDNVMGGWTLTSNYGDYTLTDGCINVTGISLPETGNRYSGSVNAIDVTNYNTLTFVVNSNTNTASNSGGNTFGLSSNKGSSNGYADGVSVAYKTFTNKTEIILDVAKLTGSFYILISCYCYNQSSRTAAYNIESITLGI